MFIFVNKDMKIIVQGLIGKIGMFYMEQVLEYYGIKMVVGVYLKKGGEKWLVGVEGVVELLIFVFVGEVKEVIGVDVFVVYVLLVGVGVVIIEVIDVEILFIVCIIEGILVVDMVKVKVWFEKFNLCLLGLNCLGILILEECKIGIMLGFIFKKGFVGVVFWFGMLIYEVVFQMFNVGFGQIMVVGIGGDLVKGIEFIDVLEMFFVDDEIQLIIMIGEIGGLVEEEVVQFLKDEVKKGCFKLMVGFIVGCIVFLGCIMGYVGVVIFGGKGGVEDKIVVMEDVGIKVLLFLVKFGEIFFEVLKG